MSTLRGGQQRPKAKTYVQKEKRTGVDVSPALSSPASVTQGDTPLVLKSGPPLTGKSSKTPSLIVKKKTNSVCVPPTASMNTAVPLFPSESRCKSYQKSGSSEELLNLLKGANVILPLPTPGPARDSSAHRSGMTSDKQKISDLENKLRKLAMKYKRLEGSYRNLLVKSIGRDSVSPDLEYTRDSAQFSLTPRRYADEPIVEVLHTLSELKAKVERIETVTATMWSTIQQKRP